MKLYPILQEVLLQERFVNLLDKNQKQQYSNVVWDMLQKSYSKIGGFKSATDAQDLVDTTGLWKLVRKNNNIVAVAVYKDLHGRKSIAGGAETDSSGKATDLGKEALMSIFIEDIKLKRSWSEVSGAAEHLKLKHGAEKIPNIYAEFLTGKKIESLHPDGYHYTRLIQGHPHEKIMVGHIPDFDPKL